MSNKLNTYIDLSKLQGAHRMTLKGKGGVPKDCLVIVLEQSRVRRSEKHPERLGLSLDIVPNREGRDEYGNTHWVKESTTKAERESADPPQLPFLGNAKEYDPQPARQVPAARSTAPDAEDSGLQAGMEDDDIPF